AKALALVLEHGIIGNTYNVGGRNERTNLQVVESICDLLDAISPDKNGARRNLISFVRDRPGHDRRYAIDASKLEREIGWRAEESFESGIEKTIHWYVNHRPWWQAILNRGYTASRVGLSQ
ncbi:MAG TPA: GDP-mannose 4,6-dehydratase, partial [Phyllobacterium sp.]|nr:GDP-mannose 4,6-dehydratase [Phyllobacterium sp.]